MRARRIEGRFLGALRDPDAAITPAEVRPRDTGLAVTVAGVPLLVVLPRDAEVAGVDQAAFAARWAGLVDAALAQAAARRLSPGARFLTEMQAGIFGVAARLGESAVLVVPRAVAALLVVAVFWGLARLLRLALRDILSNFVSGILLLWLRPFQIGDQVQVGDAEGTVERIELRATLIRAYDGRVVLVPNAEVFTSRIVNNTADPVRRGVVSVPLGYGSCV